MKRTREADSSPGAMTSGVPGTAAPEAGRAHQPLHAVDDEVSGADVEDLQRRGRLAPTQIVPEVEAVLGSTAIAGPLGLRELEDAAAVGGGPQDSAVPRQHQVGHGRSREVHVVEDRPASRRGRPSAARRDRCRRRSCSACRCRRARARRTARRAAARCPSTLDRAIVVRKTWPASGNAVEPAEHGVDDRRVVRVERDAQHVRPGRLRVMSVNVDAGGGPTVAASALVDTNTWVPTRRRRCCCWSAPPTPRR